MTCNRCPLAIENNFKTVKPRGDITKKLFIIGEAPGYKEQRMGYTFVGKAGQHLQYYINRNGLRKFVYLTNAIKCRPPRNRTPSMHELSICKPRLISELTTGKPKIIILLGNTAVNAFFGKEINNISKLLNKHIFINGTIILFNYHPSYILRNGDAAFEYDKFFSRVRVLYKYFVNKYI